MTNDLTSGGVSTSAIADAKHRLNITALWPMLGFPGEPARKCRSPFREDRNPSFEVSVDPSDGLEKWKDWSTGEHGDALDFLAKARGQTIKEARREFLALAGHGQATTAIPTLRCKGPEPSTKTSSRRPPIHPGNFRIGTKAELVALSRLRSVSVEGLEIASTAGLLRFGRCQGHLCWTVLDSTLRLAQSRRLDGGTFEGGRKSHTWKGSEQAWPLNCQSLGSHDKAALVEGGPDMLAAFGCAYAEGKETSFAIVGILGASLSIPDDALALFAGKQVKLFPHADDAGAQAAERWWTQLESVGAILSWFDFNGLTQESGEPVKDFNDLCQISHQDFESKRELWEVLP
jgi:hypothetical protein